MTMAYTERDRTVRKTLGVVGVVFVLAGIYGFFDPTFFGLFDLTATHNWVHLVTGLVYAVLGFAPVDRAVVAWTARVGGIVYALLGVVGFVAPDILEPLLVLGTNENVFHLVAGTAIAVLGFLLPVHAGERRQGTATLGERR